jgi:hypothetical protein
MPWHKSRIYYDHSTRYRQRMLHRLDLSILVATALLIVTTLFAMGSLQSGGSTHIERHGLVSVPVSVEPGFNLIDLQEVCGIGAIVCAIYLGIALFLRSRG